MCHISDSKIDIDAKNNNSNDPPWKIYTPMPNLREKMQEFVPPKFKVYAFK